VFSPGKSRTGQKHSLARFFGVAAFAQQVRDQAARIARHFDPLRHFINQRTGDVVVFTRLLGHELLGGFHRFEERTALGHFVLQGAPQFLRVLATAALLARAS
jgi:hypothetical protein